MAYFDASMDWIILVPPDEPHVKKAAGDLARCIALLAGTSGGPARKEPVIMDALDPAPPGESSCIVLNSDGNGPEQNGFTWRVGPSRVEIYGESGRGLCNGIYSFLSALGIIWPAPGQEKIPPPPVNTAPVSSCGFPLTISSANEPSRTDGNDPAAVHWRRFVPAGEKTVKKILKKSGVFVEWAARRRYDALVFPLRAFTSGPTGRKLKQLRQAAAEYGISLEAGGRDLSSLVPRSCFLFHRDFFRMEEGRRKKAHHFCPTSPGTIRLIGKEGEKLFRAAGESKIFHLWPDKGNETTWCSCPSCRAFTPQEQNRIAVNTAADILAAINPEASLVFYEKAGESGITLRKNLCKMERLPSEKEFSGVEV